MGSNHCLSTGIDFSVTCNDTVEELETGLDAKPEGGGGGGGGAKPEGGGGGGGGVGGGGGGVKVDIVGALVVKLDGTDEAAPARSEVSSESSSGISAMICDCSCASTADKSEPEYIVFFNLS